MVPGITVRDFDMLGDTAVILTDERQPLLVFVPLRDASSGDDASEPPLEPSARPPGAQSASLLPAGRSGFRVVRRPEDRESPESVARPVARVVSLPTWGRYVTHLRVAGDRIFLGGATGGLAVLDPEGTRLAELEIRRTVPRAFAPTPEGIVYYPSSRFELFHTETAGPGRQSARPFLRRPDPEPPKVSRARSGPGLEPVMVVDREGTLHRFSNRSGVVTSHDATGEIVATTHLPERVLARAVPSTRSSVGRAGGPLARGLRLGCDGEVVLTLADSRGTVVRLHPGEGRAEVVGAIGRGGSSPDHGAGSGRVATLCEGRVLAP
jgi:hypothetical protein